MSLPIAIPASSSSSRRNNTSLTPTSSYSDSGSPSSSWAPSGKYVPVHRRLSSISSSTSSNLDDDVHHPFVYSRSELLQLANSPLSHRPLSIDLVSAFPDILKSQGNEIQRALDMAASNKRPGRRSHRRTRRNRNNKKQDGHFIDHSSRDGSHSRSSSAERSWRDHSPLPHA